MVIWLCGLSGAGKTTIGNALYDRIKGRAANLVILDGEELRKALGGDLGHDAESRRVNSVRIANLCHLLDLQGIHVICCAMTIVPEAQELNRQWLSGYCEILLDVDLDTLIKRDPKGLYKKALSGKIKNVAGVDIPFVAPKSPQLVIDTRETLTDFSPIVDRILEHVKFPGATFGAMTHVSVRNPV